MVIVIMALSASFNIWITKVSLGSFGQILNDNSRCHDFQEALDLEIRAFEQYIRNSDEETHSVYQVACVRTERCLWSLPSDPQSVGTERSEMEKQLGNARLELLKSQINPHFLFNTLNMIACTAKLKDAADTEKMILSLGNLFRYNLKTREQTVTLNRELRIVEDYMYLQKMRFGSRIRYSLDLETDAANAVIPSLSLQPLVENAVVPGLSKKENGGILHIRIWKRGEILILSVSDTGLGMSKERCEEVSAAMKERRTSKIGIGLGNIYKRVHMMYEKGDLRIYSREGKGTVIQLLIPQKEDKQGGELYVPTADRNTDPSSDCNIHWYRPDPVWYYGCS